jgi:Zn-dependent protease with chaperone function
MNKGIRSYSLSNNLLLFLSLVSASLLLFSLSIHLTLPHQNFLNMLFEPCARECFKLFTLSKKVLLTFKNLLALSFLGLFVNSFLKSISQLSKTRAYSRSLEKAPLPPRMNKLLKELSIKEHHVVLFAGGLSFAFTSGILCPKIFVSAELMKCLPDEEVKAVLLHEESHRRRKDCLRSMVIYFLSNLFFFIPLLRKINSALNKSSEFIADDFVVRSSISQFVLVSALLNVKRRNFAIMKSVVGLSFADFDFERIQRLLYGEKGIPHRKYHFYEIVRFILIIPFLIVALFPQERPFGKRSHSLCDILSGPRVQNIDKLHTKPFIAIHHSGGNHEN